MKCQLIFPDKEIGQHFEQIAHFSARRARTMKSHDDLWDEIMTSSTVKRENFLRAILQEEWSLDVAELNIFIYDVEDIPSWLPVEVYRHRFLIRDWSPEQRSKRAIQGNRIPVINPFDKETEPSFWYEYEDLARRSQNLLEACHKHGIPAQKSRYACLEGTETALVVAGNARALHNIFTLRGSPDIDGDGKAAPEFMELADSMFYQAQAACPLLFEKVLRTYK